jgi:hypothetical protein
MQGAWQGLVSFVLFLSATLHGAVSPAPSAAPSRVPAAVQTSVPRVDFFGDSVTWESERWVLAALSHRAKVYMHVFGGTSICMWLPTMREVAQEHPDMVLITFAPEYPRDCDHTSDYFRELQDDAGTAAEVFAGTRVVFAADPAGKGFSQQSKVHAAYEAAARAHRNASVSYPDRVITPHDTFSEFLPCLPDETAAMGCAKSAYGPLIKVRAPDGVHLCPIIPPIPGHCPMYAPGERRFGTAVAAPAVAAFPWRPEAIAPDTSNSAK